MKTIFQILPFLLLSAAPSPAQQVVNAAGATVANAALSVEYTVGEVVIATIQSEEGAATQGLLQPTYQVISEADEAFDGQYYLRACPNPATGRLHIETDYPDFQWVQICDAAGRLVSSVPYEDSSLDVSSWAAGVYFLHFQSNQYVKTIKLVKL